MIMICDMMNQLHKETVFYFNFILPEGLESWDGGL